jgi:hypothetical protein
MISRRDEVRKCGEKAQTGIKLIGSALLDYEAFKKEFSYSSKELEAIANARATLRAINVLINTLIILEENRLDS